MCVFALKSLLLTRIKAADTFKPNYLTRDGQTGTSCIEFKHSILVYSVV